MGRFQKFRKAEIEEPVINLTPLIDVVFVILIGFIIIAPLLNGERIALAQSSEKQAIPIKESSLITIYVKKDNTIWFQDKKISLETLGKALVKEKSLHPKVIPQIFHDEQAAFGTYQKIKAILEKTGFSEVDIVLKP